jgi:NAD(P)-dependent dehydrogenase (short-subunit alcohol dehydrogenase family)
MTPMARSPKRVCLLTGAGGRLGSALCRALAPRYEVAAVYRSAPPPCPSQEQSFVDPLDPLGRPAENGHPLFAVRADLADHGAAGRVVELTLARFGRVDLLVNAAADSFWGPILGSRGLLDGLERQFLVNAVVPLRLAAEVAEKFWKHRDRENRALRRNVVNVSSTAGLFVYPGLGQSGYAASKAALNHLSCHAAAEFRAIGVRVNAVAPNSFPSIVPTESVVDAVVRLDGGSETGKVVVLDADGEQWLSAEPDAVLAS